MSGVTFEDVTKRFGEVTAVDGMTLDIADGEFMVLLGPSGCGKSTALRMIAGLEEISDGILTIGDRVVNHIPPKDRDIAMVFQSYALYPHMTVARNIESPLVANQATPGGGRRSATRRVAEAAETLDLTEYLDRKPGELSGGQRQRVALARAIVRQPAGVPDGRAAVQPGRQAAHPDPPGARRAAPAARHHHRLRHPRPGRGHDHGRPHRHHPRRPAAAGRPAPGGLRAPGEPVRGPVHRQPPDEHHRRHARRSATGPARWCTTEVGTVAVADAGTGRRRAPGSWPASAPSTCRRLDGSRRPVGPPSRTSSCSATSATPVRGGGVGHGGPPRGRRPGPGARRAGRACAPSRTGSTCSTPPPRSAAWTPG